MISDKKLKRVGSDLELGLNSYTCFDRKQSSTTEPGSSDNQS